MIRDLPIRHTTATVRPMDPQSGNPKQHHNITHNQQTSSLLLHIYTVHDIIQNTSFVQCRNLAQMKEAEVAMKTGV